MSLSWEEDADKVVVRRMGDAAELEGGLVPTVGTGTCTAEPDVITGAGLARSDFIGINATRDLMSCAKGGTGGACCGIAGNGTGKLDRPPAALTVIEGRGGSGVVGDGIGADGASPPELRRVPVDRRRGTGFPITNSPSISEFAGVMGTAECVSSLPVYIDSSSMAGLIGLMGGGDTGDAGYPRSMEEPAKKEEESSLIDFGAVDRLLRVNVVRRGAKSVSRRDLRVSRGTGV